MMEKIFKAAAQTLKWLFILIMVAFTLYPVFYTLVGSLKTNAELISGSTLLPSRWMFSNYSAAFRQGNFMQYTWNSVYLSAIVTVLALITSSLTGYVLARHEFPGRKLLLGMHLAFMFVSLGAVSLYPQYRLMHSLGLTGNLLGLALVLTGGQGTNIFLTIGFIKTLPKELDEAALIDGCSFFRVYWNVILPLLRPILGVVALFTFRTAWNDYITSFVFTMSNPLLKPLTVAVVSLRYSANAAAEWNIMTAGASIALLPVLILYCFTRKQFISGLTAGSVKG
ncbi:carbohydrate ABC transporter permease [Hydrogenispora ethanolica]|nr:carbohydrate ABC transporter permease [Hydrogenispora ethanolica]